MRLACTKEVPSRPEFKSPQQAQIPYKTGDRHAVPVRSVLTDGVGSRCRRVEPGMYACIDFPLPGHDGVPSTSREGRTVAIKQFVAVVVAHIVVQRAQLRPIDPASQRDGVVELVRVPER